MTLSDLQPTVVNDPIPKEFRRDPTCLEDHVIHIETSIQAFELALHANAAFGLADLIESGTFAKYERRVATLARAHPGGDPFAGFLSRLAVDGWPSRNSRQADRSALVRLAARDVLELAPVYWREFLANMDDGPNRETLLDLLRPQLTLPVRRQMAGATQPLLEAERRQLEVAASFLVEVRPDPFHDQTRPRTSSKDMVPDTRRRQARSAQTTLTALNRHARRKRADFPDYDWRTHFWTSAVLRDRHLDSTRRAIVATMIITGARPAEFSDDLGVDVSLVSASGQDRLLFQIKGAKVTHQVHQALPAKGQSTRTLEVECQTPEAIWLRDALREKEQLRLVAPTATEASNGMPLSPSERHRRVAVSLGKLVTRLGKLAFPGLQYNVTPYVFRHAIAADMKSWDRFEPEKIAMALGHQSIRTQECYGLKSGARNLCLKRAEGIISVSAASPVRMPDQREKRSELFSG